MIKPLDGKRPQVPASAWVAPGASVIGDIELGEEVSVWFNAVIRADLAKVRIGSRSNVQDGAVIHVDENLPTHIGKDVTIGHNAIVHGCTVGDGALVGMGAIVLSGAEVGQQALVAAGAVVTGKQKIPPRTLAAGTPARVVRELTAEELEGLTRSAAGYVMEAALYRRELDE